MRNTQVRDTQRHTGARHTATHRGARHPQLHPGAPPVSPCGVPPSATQCYASGMWGAAVCCTACLRSRGHTHGRSMRVVPPQAPTAPDWAWKQGPQFPRTLLNLDCALPNRLPMSPGIGTHSRTPGMGLAAGHPAMLSHMAHPGHTNWIPLNARGCGCPPTSLPAPLAAWPACRSGSLPACLPAWLAD